MNKAVCHDCGAIEGETHELGCDMERCPECGYQLISCGHFGIVSKNKRIPWIQYPNVCAKCGKLWPVIFMVSDEEWRRYVEPQMRSELLCRECYDFIKKAIDEEKGKDK